MAYDTSRMSLEEKDNLLQQLMEKFEGGGGGAGGAGAAAPADDPEPDDGGGDERFATLARGLLQLLEAHQQLEKVMFDFVGGLRDSYGEHQKKASIDELTGKYGKDFEPVGEAFKHMFPDGDIFSELHNMREGMRTKDGKPNPEFNDEMFDGQVKGIAQKMLERFSKMPSVKAPAAAAVKVEAAIPKGGEAAEGKEKDKAGESTPEEGDNIVKFADRVKKSGIRL